MTLEDRKALERAWWKYDEAVGRVKGACAVALELNQPALAIAREVAIRELEAAAQTFAALERVMLEVGGKQPEDLLGLHEAHYRWAWCQLQLVMA